MAQKCVAELSGVRKLATRTIDALAFAAPLAKCMTYEISKCSLENAEMWERFKK